MFEYDRTFGSVSECVGFLTDRFANETCQVVPQLPPGAARGISAPKTVPRYLFRGECGDYPTTLPSIDRLDDTSLDVPDRQQIIRLVRSIANWLQSPDSGFSLSEWDAQGTVQHLGLPTDYIDFTRSIDVAAAFASCSGIEAQGSICVLDEHCVNTDKEAHIAKLHPHDFLKRADRQKGVGVAHLRLRDLKSQEGIAAFGARWFSFRIDDLDRERYADKYRSLLDIDSDPTVGLLRWPVNMYVADIEKLHPRVAQFCADRIPMAPLVGRAHTLHDPDGLPKDFDFLLPRDYVTWDDAHERIHSLRLWSAEFPEKLPRNFMHQVQKGKDGIFVFPATHHSLDFRP
jgi:hypothetical protein